MIENCYFNPLFKSHLCYMLTLVLGFSSEVIHEEGIVDVSAETKLKQLDNCNPCRGFHVSFA